MRKTLLSGLLMVCSALASMAQADSKVYTEVLYVTINGQTNGPLEAGITVVDHKDGTFDFVLKNFILADAETTMPVGNIEIPNIELQADSTFSFQGDVQMTAGDMQGVEMWLGTMLPPIPMNLTGRFKNDGHMAVHVDIDMTETLQQVIEVDLGQEPSAIGTPDADCDETSTAYDLLGRQTGKNAKGIIILGGKKVLK